MEIKCDKCGAVSTTITPETYITESMMFITHDHLLDGYNEPMIYTV